MALDSVVDEIINNAREEAKAVKAEGKSEATEILKKAKASASDTENRAADDAKKLVGSVEGKEMSNANRECKRMELDAKKEAIDEVFSMLEKRVFGLDEKTKRKIYEKMIKKAVAETDAKVVFANSKDNAIIKAVAPGLTVKTDNEISGGLVIENADGTVRIDSTFKSRLTEMRDEYLEDVSKILFK